MQLYKIHTNILTPFINETINSLDSTADLNGRAGEAYVESLDEFEFRGFAVCVVAKTFGAIEGKIIMNHTIDSALLVGNKIRNKLLGETETRSKIDEDISEAMTEFSNIAIGLATQALSDADLKITFSSPIFISDQEEIGFLTDGVKEILTIPIDIEGSQRFHFSYLLHNSAE